MDGRIDDVDIDGGAVYLCSREQKLMCMHLFVHFISTQKHTRRVGSYFLYITEERRCLQVVRGGRAAGGVGGVEQKGVGGGIR